MFHLLVRKCGKFWEGWKLVPRSVGARGDTKQGPGFPSALRLPESYGGPCPPSVSWWPLPLHKVTPWEPGFAGGPNLDADNNPFYQSVSPFVTSDVHFTPPFLTK